MSLHPDGWKEEASCDDFIGLSSKRQQQQQQQPVASLSGTKREADRGELILQLSPLSSFDFGTTNSAFEITAT